MAKSKNKLNKTNSSGWLDNYSEEFSISEYQDGGKLKQYFNLPTKRVAVDNTYNKNSPIVNSSDDKEMVNRLLREKANESKKAKEKRIADVKRLEELNKKSMLETANAKDLYDIGEGMKSKYRFSNEDNFFDDYINPLNMVGGMAGGLAQTPELINQGEYGNAALNVGLPLTVGALAGIGTQNAGQFVNNLVNPFAGTGNLFKRTNNLTSSVDDVVQPITLQPWQIQELPGLHLKSTMEGEAISKIIEPKTGLINTEQALAIIGKESGGADKVAIIRQGLGDNIPKKMDYNEFRKTVQNQLIPLEQQFVNHSSNYGLSKIGYPSPKRSSFEAAIKNTQDELQNWTKVLEETKAKGHEFGDIESHVNNLKQTLEKNYQGLKNIPLENQTLILGNKNRFGRGSDAHGNPEETLGHAHFLRDAETPDVLTVTQIQSDAFQGTHRNMPKNAPDASKVEKSLQRMQEIQERNKSVLNKMKTEGVDEAGLPVQQYQIKQFEDIVQAQETANLMKKAELKNFTQKALLDKNHQERYLQELVDYAGKRGDVNKVRVPTSETAAKVQGYSKNTATIMDEMGLPNLEFSQHTKLGYSSEHQTILKKYSEQPKTIKKLFGKEPTTITDSKGNTWYEFDIPEKFKKGKGEIKAFGLAPAIGLGAASQFYNGQGEGEINQYEDGGKVKDKKSTLSKLKKALSLRENLGNLDTKEGYFTPLNQLLRTAVGIEGKDYSNEPMEPIAREQDALRMYLGLPSKTGAFEQTAPNKYRIRDYNKLYPDTLLSDEAVRDWGVPNEDGVPDPVNPAFDLYPYDDFVMGKHYVTKGKNAKGEYLKYSDRFDFDPTRYANQFIDRNVNPTIGKYLKKATPVLDELENLMFNPFELEDKIYYDPKTKLRSDIILQQNAPKVYPGQPMATPPEFAQGGKINDNNGYLISNLDNFTPKKIINSNYITTNNMAFPVKANGVVLYPNTGDYVFSTDKVTEIPIIKNGGKINNDMKKKLKKYQGGGYLNYQDSYKGFGVGPQLYQDNSYFRSVMPTNIENMEEEINKPSVFSGINDVLGAVNQGVSQATGLLSQFGNMSGNMPQIMPDISNWQAPGTAAKTNEQLNFENSDAYLNWQNDQKLKQAGLFDSFYSNQNTQTGIGFMGNTPTVKTVPSANNFNWNVNTPSFNLPTGKNGGYLKKYQDGGMMDMLPVGFPEYIHKSNVFHENYNPVPRVHFSDNTTPYDMGVNLNDLVNMNGGRINKYQYGGMMPFYSRQRSPRVFNSNANRASAADLESAYANDFMHTKVRKDRQSFEDDKVDWGFMDWAKEPVGALTGVLSTVPIVGDITQSALGDSFLTRTGGYAIGKGVGNVGMGAAKVIGGAATGNVGMIGSGIGDVGEGVGSTVGTFQAKDALSNYDKSGYVSGNRLVRSSQDFGNMMDTASGLFGNIKGGVGMVKNMGGLKGMMGNMKGGAKGMKGFGNIMSNITGIRLQDGGIVDYNFNNIEEYKYGGKVSQKINKKQNKAGWLDQL